jgi:hypothetical protein
VEYNYEDKEKLDKLKNDPTYKKENRKKLWVFIIACLPFLVGLIIYLVFFSSSDSFIHILKNSILSYLAIIKIV